MIIKDKMELKVIALSIGLMGLGLFVLFVIPKYQNQTTHAEQTGTTIQDLSYTYDPAGNIVEINDQSDLYTSKKMTYGYDDLNRLLSAQSTGFQQGDYAQTYQYDPLGNMTYKSDVGSMVHGGTGFPNPHAITEVAGKTYSYDKNGNVTSDGENTYTWSIRNELTSVTTPNGTTMEYKYDGLGEKVKSMNKKTGEETIYVNKYMEIRPDKTIYYIWAGDTRVAALEVKNGETKEQGKLKYFHQDHLGGTNVVTDEQGKVIEIIDYEPYGEEIVHEVSGDSKTAYTFTGKEHEPDTGLTYFGARYYNPETGRFVSEDPVAMNEPEKILDDPQSLNAYAYTRNNPVNLVDPDGKFWQFVAALVGVVFTAWDAIDIGQQIQEGNYAGAATSLVLSTVNPLPNGATKTGAQLGANVVDNTLKVVKSLGPKVENSVWAMKNSINNLTQGAELMSKNEKLIQWGKSGGYEQAVEDFKSLVGGNFTEKTTEQGTILVGQLSDGSMVNVRNFSSEGSATIEIQRMDSIGEADLKYRY